MDGAGPLRHTVSMIVKRIVANIAATDVAKAKAFYGGLLGLEVVMDHGWITTFASSATTTPQISIASAGGSGTPVPDLSIEVDDLDEALRRVRAAGLAIEYGPAAEPWGVRRFYVRDPFGRLVNILCHDSKSSLATTSPSGRRRRTAARP
jgi:catechol 2,3-dioxygenase-like lactoylglutathione lyase family enzyme